MEHQIPAWPIVKGVVGRDFTSELLVVADVANAGPNVPTTIWARPCQDGHAGAAYSEAMLMKSSES